MNGPETVYEAALEAYDAGLCVIRAHTDGSKRPVGEWEHWQRERPTRDQVDTWFADGHEAMGLVTGGKLEMLELEGRFLATIGLPRWKAALAEAGLAELWEHITAGYAERSPSKGRHVFWLCEEISGNQVLARDRDRQVLIETRGEGGFVITAPSNGRTHRTGEAWVRLRGGFATIAVISPAQRAALLEVARSFDQAPDEVESERVKPPGEKGDGGTLPGFDVTTDAVLEAAGFVVHHADRKGNRHYTRPGKDVRDGSSLTVWADDGRATPWSSSIAMPAEFITGRRLLTAWQLYVALNHAGHFDEAAREWRREHPRVSVVGRISPAEVDPETGEVVGASPPAVATRLPDEFWEARPWLRHIRQAAHSRQRSADAVLHAVLARAAAITPHTTLLPAIVGSPKPLCYFANVIATPGIGKSDANDIAGDLMPAPEYVVDQLPIGSGEGLIEALMALVEEPDDKGKMRQVKRQVHHNVYVFIDEGQVLGELGARKGSTLLPTLRTIWTGGTLGQANATNERHRVIFKRNYAFGVIAGYQAERVGPLLDDAGGGTPQRFGWAYATDPAIPDHPPEWPGPLVWTPLPKISGGRFLEVHPETAAEIRAADRARAREEVVIDPLEAHAGLYRLKVAGLLGPAFEGRWNITLEDWALAGMVKTASDAVRTNVVNLLRDEAARKERATRERYARRAVEADTASRHTAAVDGARKIGEKVWAEPDRWTVAALRRSVSLWLRDIWADALDYALAEGWVIETVEPGQGTEKRSLRPGKVRP